MMAEPEDEDGFPNDFDGLDFDGIPLLQAPPTSTHTPVEVPSPSAITRNIVESTTASPVLSTRSNSVENMDSSFLAAVDALEARILSEMPRASGSLLRSELGGYPTNAQTLDTPRGEGTISLSQVREDSKQSTESSSATRKGKRKAEPQEDIDVGAILAGYESELTCPICYELLVGAQVANPCGHTCCGECGYGWLAQNKCEPTCALCRASLSTRKPLLPNFSADNLVRQHLQALAKSGRPDWQEKGYRTIEWNKRLESWKKIAAVRAAKEKSKEAAARLRRCQQRYYDIEEYWLDDESMDDNREASIPRVMPRRGTRTRR